MPTQIKFVKQGKLIIENQWLSCQNIFTAEAKHQCGISKKKS